jgi:hypothetical protein
MPAPKKAHDEMVTRAHNRIKAIFNVIEIKKEASLTSKLSRNLTMGEERVDLLLHISYQGNIYALPVEIETQEGNMLQIEKNIGKCVEAFGGVLIIPRSSMVDAIKKTLKHIPVAHSRRTIIISYALLQNKSYASDAIIKEAIGQLLILCIKPVNQKDVGININ